MNVNDIKPVLESRKEKYVKYGLNQGVQSIIVGDDLDNIKHSFVAINDVLYEVETPLKAIDIAFKVTQALDTKYPAECSREWLFLQLAVYEIKTSYDKDISDAKVLAVVEGFSKFKIHNNKK
ncbi:hypothetical protein PUN28_006123 [Cardiocondyla obscurior]|uniref:Uncharacterized protein n=1 Tax=Cardiocondyla obscurior TaxID=286306 RepID=A0AAW2G9G0_9HYME